MKKLQILGVALVAMFAFSAIVVASASAAVTFLLAEWLVNGADAAGQNVEAVGTILLEDTGAFGGAAMECSGILDGTVGADGLGVVSEVLNLAGTTVISLSALTEPGVACVKLSGLCEEPLAWAVHLPWNTLLELMEEGTPVERFFAVLVEDSGAGLPGWYIHCMKTFLEPEDECTAPNVAGKGNGVFELSLEAGSLLLGKFSEAFTNLAEELLATCSIGGAETGIVETIPQEIRLAAGGTLSASSEEGTGTLEA
jgi:hypothetical protein